MDTLPQAAQIITIGDELLAGRTQDTNSHYIARALHQLGLPVVAIQTVPDTAEAIRTALDRALPNAALVLLTGGLGPTKDDITKHTLASYFGGDTRLVPHTPTLERLRAYFKQRGRDLTEVSAQMANVPANCIPLENPAGAAPGLLWSRPDGRIVAAMPGVPHEMKAIFETHIRPIIASQLVLGVVKSRVFRTVGIPESSLSALLAPIEDGLPQQIKLAYNPGLGILDLRLVLVCATSDADHLLPLFKTAEDEIQKLISPYHFADDETPLAEAVGRMLHERKHTLATAESCTGGGLAASIVSVSGSSAYFLGSVVAYSNPIKSKLLSVSKETLDDYGAVSEPTALQMAIGVRELLGTTWGLATTGVAGPLGGSDEKPVGTVWIALAGPNGSTARKFTFENNRERNIQRTIVTALHLLWKQLSNSA